jgi:4a-hydroxytetrahydrobiopterin dehydratase
METTPRKLDRSAAEARLAELGSAWKIDGQGHLERTFRFPDFAGALAFANEVGAIAERENHHPDLHVGWGRVRIEVFTHSIGGLSEKDFHLAAKIEALSPKS